MPKDEQAAFKTASEELLSMRVPSNIISSAPAKTSSGGSGSSGATGASKGPGTSTGGITCKGGLMGSSAGSNAGASNCSNAGAATKGCGAAELDELPPTGPNKSKASSITENPNCSWVHSFLFPIVITSCTHPNYGMQLRVNLQDIHL